MKKRVNSLSTPADENSTNHEDPNPSIKPMDSKDSGFKDDLLLKT